ncbi:5-deoxy-glucuronate isomerase [Arsenicitalea aurantiaca]|uniref:5-deoxy-glucuronate isomerase n=1 Tax=Arsenicitalea aurantiaca TaxID=1783274 RepID=A0A433X5F5_9HYPH|nr:5-deoxy-glucuronate isomerase [Arsenicitalea aurantiaca]RUT29284.1 5-deoxy-glucuronate isomerase [Arsenicitalea aurantiaca]
MAHLRLRPNGNNGLVQHVTPQSAGWRYVGFDVFRAAAGETVRGETGACEICLVFVSGTGHVVSEDVDFGMQGGRMSPFDGAPAAIFLPPGRSWSVAATSALELAVCSAPGIEGVYAPRIVTPEPQFSRGTGSNTRHVTNILPETEPAHALLIVEVITPAGHTSSYPSHKHDEDNLPAESQLEETYYHRFNPSQGFGFQRVYTDDRSLDVAMVIEDRDVTLVPRGYHPCAAIHGYDLYYLNVMAGPHRVWRFHNDPDHEWLVR